MFRIALLPALIIAAGVLSTTGQAAMKKDPPNLAKPSSPASGGPKSQTTPQSPYVFSPTNTWTTQGLQAPKNQTTPVYGPKGGSPRP